MSQELFTKFNSLREKYKKQYRGWPGFDEAMQSIEQEEKRLKRMITESEYQENEITQGIVALVKGQIRELNILILNEAVSEQDRHDAFLLRKCYRFYINLFTKDPEKEIQELMKEVESKL